MQGPNETGPSVPVGMLHLLKPYFPVLATLMYFLIFECILDFCNNIQQL